MGKQKGDGKGWQKPLLHTIGIALVLAGLLGCGDSDKATGTPQGNGQQVSCQLQIAASLIEHLIEMADRPVGRLNPGVHAVVLPRNGWQAIYSGGNQALVYDLQRTPWLYDARNDWWTDLKEATASRGDPTLTRLPNGKILITGGHDGTVLIGGGLNNEGDFTDRAEVFDPQTNSFTLLDSQIDECRYDFMGFDVTP